MILFVGIYTFVCGISEEFRIFVPIGNGPHFPLTITNTRQVLFTSQVVRSFVGRRFLYLQPRKGGHFIFKYSYLNMSRYRLELVCYSECPASCP